MSLAEASSWSGVSWEEGCKRGRSHHQIWHGHGHGKTCFPFSLEGEAQIVGTRRWGSGWCPLHMKQCGRYSRCLAHYLWELLCVHLGKGTLSRPRPRPPEGQGSWVPHFWDQHLLSLAHRVSCSQAVVTACITSQPRAGLSSATCI